MKTRILFILISSYILAAFGWWTYSLIKLRQEDAGHKLYELQHEAENIKQHVLEELFEEIAQKQQFGNVDALNLFHKISPGEKYILTLRGNISQNTKAEELASDIEIIPSKNEEENIRLFLNRKITQYLLEGMVFGALLVWGMVVIYRNFKSKLLLNQQQNNFLLAVTHELKTPVAAIKLMLQTLKRRSLPEEQKEQMMEDSLRDADRLESLVENVLMATRMEGQGYQFQFEELNFTDLLEEEIGMFARQNHKNQRFITDFPENITIKADRFALSIALTNLLNNSVKYSPAGAEISVSLDKTGNEVVFTLQDAGSPIPETERNRIFKKFYRIGNENTRNNKGTGLGLYIVKQVLKGHNASIILSSNGKGNTFEIRFQRMAS